MDRIVIILTLIWFFLLLVSVSYGNAKTIDWRHLCLLFAVIIGAILFSIVGYHHGYKEGQIDAIEGEIHFKQNITVEPDTTYIDLRD